jgi:hydrogenase maturation factor
MTYTLLMPGAASEDDARTLVGAISSAAKELGISILGGHTGWYDAVNVPTVGGVTVWAFADRGRCISPGGAREGDVLLMTKGPAIEATALLGVLYRDRLADRLDRDTLDAACARTSQITVVEDALTAFDAGGVHAMHDATEGGVLGGLWEMAAASGLKVRADVDSVPTPPDVEALGGALGFDPWSAISEGTLLAAVEPQAVEKVMAAWSDLGIAGYRLGELHAERRPSTLRRDGQTVELTEPGRDPFWDLFFAGLAPAG